MRNGPPWLPDAPENVAWALTTHQGMVLREAVRDASGKVVSETVKPIPLDRDLQAAMEWARAKYWTPS